jgi:hypothetical protein
MLCARNIRRRPLRAVAVGLVAAPLSAVVLGVFGPQAEREPPATPLRPPSRVVPGHPAPAASSGYIAGRVGRFEAPARYAPAFIRTPRALTPGQIAASQVAADKNYPGWAARRAGTVTANVLAGPAPGTETLVVPAHSDPDFRSTVHPLDPPLMGLAVRMVAEPAIALSDQTIWMTGNWFAARSADGGVSWDYVDPYADFPTFTSDQDTIFDPHRHLFVWYRQGGLLSDTALGESEDEPDGGREGRVDAGGRRKGPGAHLQLEQPPPGPENSVKLAVSADEARTWCTYSLVPTDLDPGWIALDFDYPRLALSDNYLYVASTLLTHGDGYATPRMVLLRLPLDALAACSEFSYTYWAANEGWDWAPIESGATDTMYLGDTLDPGGASPTGTFRLYTQAEETTDLTFVDRSVPAWTFTNRDGLCPVAGGGNPCARADQRITSGWLRHSNGSGEIGFLWNVRDGGGFPYPYVDAVTFDEASLTVTGRPLLWGSDGAWQYASAAPNDRGDLGVAAFYFGPAENPAHAVGIAEGLGQRRWTAELARTSDFATDTVIWGDYIRVRARGSGFVASGYVIGEAGSEPFCVSFRRLDRDHLVTGEGARRQGWRRPN